jgi:hypothetical protein
MGQEILYCAICQTQIRSVDLAHGQAFELENKTFCLKCGPEMLGTLPKARVKEIFKDITTPAKGTHLATATPRPGTTRKFRAGGGPGRRLVPVAAVGILLLVLVFWLILGKTSTRDATLGPPESRPVARDSKPLAAPVPLPPSVHPTPSSATTAGRPMPPAPLDKEKAAQEALQKAREWAQGNPSDFDGAIRRFQDAAFLASGSSRQAEMSQELELYRRKQRDFFATELATLEPEVKAACAEERFMKALDILKLAKDRHDSAEWQLTVGKRSREINDEAFRLLNRVKEEALEAQGRADEEKVKALRARVAAWGVERFIKDFRDAVDR